MSKKNSSEELVLVPELKQFTATSFMGIDSGAPVVIDFSKSRGKGFVEASGNQGVGKSSLLLGIIYAMAGNVNVDKVKLMSSIDKDIDEELLFTHDGEDYKVEAGKSRFTLKKNVGNDKWANQSNPVETIKKIFGPVGLFPIHIKEMDGRKQIKFFQDMFGSGEDATPKMKKLETEIEKAFSERRDKNRDIKTLKGALESNKLYADYEKSQKKYAVPVIVDKEKEKFEAIKTRHDDFKKYSDGLSRLVESEQDITQEISDLEEKLKLAKEQLADVSSRVEKGKKWVEENKGVVAEYEKADKEWVEVAQRAAEYQNWQQVLKDEKKLITWEDEALELTGQIDEKREELLKTIKKCLPKVEGLSIKVSSGIDSDKNAEGVFYLVPGKDEDQPIHELSESEYADMWCKIWEAAGISVIVVENITSFGSTFIDTLNQFVKNGGTVFYSKMDRKIDEMKITFKSEVQ